MGTDNVIYLFISVLFMVNAKPTPDGAIRFPNDGQARQSKKMDEVITPPVLPVLPHLENDPSTLLPNETSAIVGRSADEGTVTGNEYRSAKLKTKQDARFGFSNAFDVSPNQNGGLTASFSNGINGFGGNNQAASQSLSFGFNNGFQASHSASQSNAYNHGGFLGPSLSGSQASSQSSNFNTGYNGLSSSQAAASAGSFSGPGFSGSAANSQAASNNFGWGGPSSSSGQSSSFGASFNGNSGSGAQSSTSNFNGGNGSPYYNNSPYNSGSNYEIPNDYLNFGEGELDIRHRGLHRNRGHSQYVETSVVFPGKTNGRNGYTTFSNKASSVVQTNGNRWRNGNVKRGGDEWYAILVSDK